MLILFQGGTDYIQQNFLKAIKKFQINTLVPILKRFGHWIHR